MSLATDLIDLNGKDGELVTTALDYFLGDIGKLFRFSLPQLVTTDPFYRITKSQTSVDKDFAKSDDLADYVQIVPEYSTSSTSLDYYKAMTKMGPRSIAMSKALPFSVPLDIIKTHTEQAAIVMHRDMAVALTASSFAAAQKQAAGTAWSVTATADPRGNVDNLKDKLFTGSNIRGDYQDENMRVVMLISYNSAVEAMATDDYGTWKANAGKDVNGTMEEKLKEYFEVPEVIILDTADHNGSAIYTDIVDLAVVDRTGIAGFARDNSLLVANHSGLITAYLESGNMFAPGQTYTVNVAGMRDAINVPIIGVREKEDAHGDMIFTCKAGYKVYNHKTAALVGLTGV
jgi:hypothetical protein